MHSTISYYESHSLTITFYTFLHCTSLTLFTIHLDRMLFALIPYLGMIVILFYILKPSPLSQETIHSNAINSESPPTINSNTIHTNVFIYSSLLLQVIQKTTKLICYLHTHSIIHFDNLELQYACSGPILFVINECSYIIIPHHTSSHYYT